MSDRTNAPPPPHPPTPAEIRAWLDFEFSGLIARRDELVSAVRDFLAAHPTVDSDEVQGSSAENRRMCSALRKVAEEQRTTAKRPLRDAATALDAWFANAVAPLTQPLADLTQRETAYASAKFEREETARRVAAEAARVEADRKAAEAAEAMALERPGSDRARLAVADAGVAEEKAAEAEAATAVKPADVTRTRGEFGAVSSLRTHWRWREVDHAKVPPKYTEVSAPKINAAVKLGGRNPDGSPRITIPGIQFYAERTV